MCIYRVILKRRVGPTIKKKGKKGNGKKSGKYRSKKKKEEKEEWEIGLAL